MRFSSTISYLGRRLFEGSLLLVSPSFFSFPSNHFLPRSFSLRMSQSRRSFTVCEGAVNCFDTSRFTVLKYFPGPPSLAPSSHLCANSCPHCTIGAPPPPSLLAFPVRTFHRAGQVFPWWILRPGVHSLFEQKFSLLWASFVFRCRREFSGASDNCPTF